VLQQNREGSWLPVSKATAGWNDRFERTEIQRRKEEASDYRYFPEPDLPPLVVDDAWIARVRGELPELPIARWQRFQSLGLSAYDAGVLTAERDLADYFDAVLAAGAPPKDAANWVSQHPEARPRPEHVAELIQLIKDGTISTKIAKEIFPKLTDSPRAIVEREGLVQLTDAGAIEAACRAVVDANPKQVAQYKGGNPKIIGFFVGQVMKATQGKANPEMVNDILKKLLA